jgi:hypothetical protein
MHFPSPAIRVVLLAHKAIAHLPNCYMNNQEHFNWKHIYLLVLLSCISLVSFAQSKTVTGTVKDQVSGTPVQDATMQLKGSNQTTLSDASGRFSIAVPSAKSVLVISHVSFGTQEITVGNETSIDINISNAVTNFNEIVV